MHRLNSRLTKMEKQTAPTIAEIEQVLNRVMAGTPELAASKRLFAGTAEPGDQELVNAFWLDRTWHGAKQALDARWERRLWEPVFDEHWSKRHGFKNYTDEMACDIWLMEMEPETFMAMVKPTESNRVTLADMMTVYGRFNELPEDDRRYWRELATDEIAARYDGRKHSWHVQRLLDNVNRLQGEKVGEYE